MQIEHLNFTPRTYLVLKRANINTAEQLSQLTDADLLRVRNLGQTSLAEIRKRLACPPPFVELDDDNFGTVLNCAVRYACGRRTYMPGLVINFIKPLIPHLSSKTLWCFDKDLAEARYQGGYGDDCDEKDWLEFHRLVRTEREKRGEKPCKSWRENWHEPD